MLKLNSGSRNTNDQPLQKKVRLQNDFNLHQDKAFQNMLNCQSQQQQESSTIIPQRIQQNYQNFNLQSQSSTTRIPRFVIPKFDMTLTMFSSIQEKIFFAIHLLYQDASIIEPHQPELLYLLYGFAVNIESENYVDYYLRIDPTLAAKYRSDPIIPQLPTLRPTQQLQTQQQEFVLPNDPYDLSIWAQGLYQGTPQTFPVLFKQTKQICTILEYLVNGEVKFLVVPKFFDDQRSIKLISSHSEVMPLYLSQQKPKHQIQSNSKDIKALELILKKNQTLQFLQCLPLYASLPILEMLARVGKDGTWNKCGIDFNLNDQMYTKACELLQRWDCYRNRKLYNTKQNDRFKLFVDQTIRGQRQTQEPGLEENEEIGPSHLPYAENAAVQEVLRIFDYLRDINIKQSLTEHINEEKLEQEAQIVLQKLLSRRAAIFIGLGALQYGNTEHCITEQVRFPQINTAGVLAQNGMKLQLDQTREEFQQWQQWPEFHLGTALALQLSQKLKGLSHGALRTWIFYQKPTQPSNIYGGFMYGLGLLGYLDALNQIDIYHLLIMNMNHSQSNECTQVGVLLGIGASRRGKCDETTQKSLSVHIPSLIPSVLDLELPQNVPTSALCGLGLLFAGSGNRNFSEVALGLIGRKPSNDKVVDREGYSLAAGVTLGLINLGKGSVWRRELQVEDRLIRFIQGGTVLPPPQSTLSTSFMQNEGNISSVKEGNMVNTHVTCPGALMALSLMYLQKNNTNIIQYLRVPENFSELENCNPNHVLLKVLCRNLIMWDTMPITSEDIYAQIPELIRFLYEQPLRKINQKYYLVYNTEVIDFLTVSQVYTSTIAGCLLALGIKFAGTHEASIKALILHELEELLKVKISQNELANDPESKNSVDQYTYFTNTLNTLVSLSLVMAGSFDQDGMQACKRMRKRLETSQIWHFGFHQALSLATGFLHLGRGAYSFKKDLLSISMIAISVYPYYPAQTTDNKQYLQALRWTYVLAIKPRIFKTVDASSNQVVQVKTQVQTTCFENSNFQQQIYSVRVIDDKYFPLDINLEKEKKSIQLLYVQERKIAKLDQQFIQQSSITKNLSTLTKQLQFNENSNILNLIDQGLKGIKEWQIVKETGNKLFIQWFVELLENDHLIFIPALAKMIQQEHNLQTIKAYYKNFPGVLTLNHINQIQESILIDKEFIHKFKEYFNNKEVNDEIMYKNLHKLGIPNKGELNLIKKFASQIPEKQKKQILQFYLLKAYHEPIIAELLLNVLI